MNDLQAKYNQLLQPSSDLISDIAKLNGDILILGAGGKMGPSLAKLAKEAINKTGVNKKVIAVSRFSEQGLQQELEQAGIETMAADLLNESDLQQLPEVKNVLYLAGTKFGTTGNESLTWAMNTYLAGRVAEKYKDSNIVVFSTGNVYPLTDIKYGGAKENDSPGPIGEYAQSCLGRERMFGYFSSIHQTPLFIYRLNYANDVSYGVLLEIAKAVFNEKPIDLRMGYVNVIWQNDANEIAIRALNYCTVPGKILNVTGPDILSVRKIAQEFGNLLNKKPRFINKEEDTALLSDAGESIRLFGYPKTLLTEMMAIIAEWVKEGGKTLNKPTHFQERQGQF